MVSVFLLVLLFCTVAARTSIDKYDDTIETSYKRSNSIVALCCFTLWVRHFFQSLQV